jgi:hypothetical protein
MHRIHPAVAIIQNNFSEYETSEQYQPQLSSVWCGLTPSTNWCGVSANDETNNADT